METFEKKGCVRDFYQQPEKNYGAVFHASENMEELKHSKISTS